MTGFSFGSAAGTSSFSAPPAAAPSQPSKTGEEQPPSGGTGFNWSKLAEQATALATANASSFGSTAGSSSSQFGRPSTSDAARAGDVNLSMQTAWPALPRLQKGIAQIEQQSKRLMAKRPATTDLQEDEMMTGDPASANKWSGEEAGGFLKGQVLLASKGFDAQKLGEHVMQQHELDGSGNMKDASMMMVDDQPLTEKQDVLATIPGFEIDAYLNVAYETLLIDTLEMTRKQANRVASEVTERSFQADWERTKQTADGPVNEEFRSPTSAKSNGGSHYVNAQRRSLNLFSNRQSVSKVFAHPYASAPTEQRVAMDEQQSDPMLMQAKRRSYYECLKKLNEARLHQRPFSYFSRCRETALKLENRSTTAPLTQSVTADTWTLLQKMVGEKDIEGGWRKGYCESAYNEMEAKMTRFHIIRGGRRWLEDLFSQHIEDTLASNAKSIAIGGRPDVTSKIQAYTQLRLCRQGQWLVPNLESVKGVPVYAMLWFMVRAGYAKEAVTLVQTQYRDFFTRTNEDFPSMFKEAVDCLTGSTPMSVSEPNRAQAQNEWQRQLARGTTIDASVNGRDAFRVALIKWIGHCDVSGAGSKKTVPFVTNGTTDDYLWYQLLLLSENYADATIYKYNLRDLQALVTQYGPEHFCQKNNNPWMYFRALLLTSQFEKAVDYLVRDMDAHVEAIHCAIGLVYYGLMRTPSPASAGDKSAAYTARREDLLVPFDREPSLHLPALLFSKLITMYISTFAATHAEEAMQYTVTFRMKGLLGTSALVERSVDDTLLNDVRHALHIILHKNANWDELLGGIVDGDTRTPGMIHKFAALLHLKDIDAFVKDITKAAAARQLEHGHPIDAMRLYNLAEEYDQVLRILNKMLASCISRFTDNSNASSILKEDESPANILIIAENIIQYYSRQPELDRAQPLKHTCLTLIQIVQFFDQISKQNWVNAIEIMEALDLLPLSYNASTADLPDRAIRLYRDYDEHLATHIDDILLTTMQALLHIYEQSKAVGKQYNDTGRLSYLSDIKKKARLILTFVATLEGRVQGDTHQALTEMQGRMN